MPTSPPALTSPPTAPQRSSPSTFATRADAWVGWLETWAPDFATAADNVYDNALETAALATAAATNADEAAASEAAAAGSAQTAANSAGAAIWITGTTYAIGDVRWSPATNYVYRRLTAGAGATDPSADPTNWALAGTTLPQMTLSVSTSNAMTANQHIVLTNAAASTATLPGSPVAGDACWITVGNDRIDNVIARNGELIMGLAENMTIDLPTATVCLRYVNYSFGWRAT